MGEADAGVGQGAGSTGAGGGASPNEPSVTFEERPGGGGRRIGIARLNRPRRINALDLDCCERLLAQARRWADDPGIAAVVLAGNGEKGFCAGGDVGQVVRDLGQGPAGRGYGERFFAVEYELDLLLHCLPKPLVTWAHGVTMGGGIGLSVAGSHRVVATGARLAMPEIHIGLFPDVGGGWFLNRVPGEAGVLIALTGVVLGEADAVFARLADYVLPHASQSDFIDGFAAIDWGRSAADHRAQATFFCRGFEAARPAGGTGSALRERYDAIRSICTRAKLSGILAGLGEAAATDPWFAGPYESLKNGSPTAAAVTLSYLRRCRLLGLAEVLALDLVVARQCLRHPDFPEGVRALLIDKDKSPRWSPATADAVGVDLVEGFFRPVD